MTSDSPEDPRDSPFVPEPERPIDDLMAALGEAEQVYLKKLSLNDWQWSENPLARQGGVYIPHEDRDSGFFPRSGSRTVQAASRPFAKYGLTLSGLNVPRPRRPVWLTTPAKGRRHTLPMWLRAHFKGSVPLPFLSLCASGWEQANFGSRRSL